MVRPYTLPGTWLIAAALSVICCGNYDIDRSFSEDLTILAQNFGTAGSENRATSVDEIRIYEVDFRNRELELTRLERLKPLLRNTERQSIDRFFEAVQDEDGTIPSCALEESARIFHVLAIDNQRDRPGAFIVFWCEASGKDVAAIEPFGGAGVYYNRKLKPFLEAELKAIKIPKSG